MEGSCTRVLVIDARSDRKHDHNPRPPKQSQTQSLTLKRIDMLSTSADKQHSNQTRRNKTPSSSPGESLESTRHVSSSTDAKCITRPAKPRSHPRRTSNTS